MAMEKLIYKTMIVMVNGRKFMYRIADGYVKEQIMFLKYLYLFLISHTFGISVFTLLKVLRRVLAHTQYNLHLLLEQLLSTLESYSQPLLLLIL